MQMLGFEFRNEKRKLKDLVPWEGNPRKMTPRQKMLLEGKLRKYGLVVPLVIDTKGVLVSGHQRAKILSQLLGGEYEIDVRVPDKELTPEQFVDLNLTLNKVEGEFDLEELANLDEKTLREGGFDDKEIDKIKGDDMAGLPAEGREDFASELREENNYIVFAFDDSLDWQVITQFFDLKPVEALDSKSGYRKKGVGRVLNGNVLLRLINSQLTAGGNSNDLRPQLQEGK